MLPPGPRAPALVQITAWIARPLTLLQRCQRRYGDVFTLSVPGGEKFVIVAAPDLIKQVLAADTDILLAGVGNATVLEPLFGRSSLLTLDGDEHLRQRRLLSPAFHGARMQKFATVMREITEASFAQWPVGQPFALHAAFWHNKFGRRRSHGCVNLAPLDAARVFAATSPAMPPGWTFVYEHEDEPGTTVRIRKGTAPVVDRRQAIGAAGADDQGV